VYAAYPAAMQTMAITANISTINDLLASTASPNRNPVHEKLRHYARPDSAPGYPYWITRPANDRKRIAILIMNVKFVVVFFRAKFPNLIVSRGYFRGFFAAFLLRA
jgi:hypothetical protein